MAADGSVVIEILGDDSDITSKLKGVAGGAVDGLKTAFGAVTAAVGASTAAVGGFAASSVKVGMNFDKSMSQVAATMGKTTGEIQDLRDFAMEMGATTAFSATQAAEALNYMALAGYDSEKSMQMLPNVMNLAAAGGVGLARASDMVTDAQSALGLSIDETASLVDKMAMASSKSNTSVEQLGDAILTVGGTAKNLSGGTTELATALGILADNGVKGAEGGTALRNVILSLSAPTDKAAKTMAQLGVNAYDADGSLRPLNETFGDLNGALSKMTQGQQTEVLNTLFNKVDLKSVNALLSNTVSGVDDIGAALEQSGVDWEKYKENVWAVNGSIDGLVEEVEYGLKEVGISAEELKDYLIFEYELDAEDAEAVIASLTSRWDELSGYIDNATGAAEKMAQTKLDNLAGDVTLFMSALEGVQLLISGELSGGLREFVQMGTEGLSKMSEAFKEDGISGAISVLTETLAQMTAKAAEQIPAFVSTGAQLLTALVTGLVTALPGLLSQLPAIVQSVADAFSAAAPELMAAGKELLAMLGDGITQGVPELAAQLPGVISSVTDFISNSLPEFLTKGAEIAGAFLDGIISSLPDLLGAGAELIASIYDGISSSLPDLVSVGLDVVASLIDGLSSSSSRVIDAAFSIVQSLGSGLIDSIPVVSEKAPAIIGSIVGAIIDNAPMLLISGISLIANLASGLISAIPVVVAAIPEIIGAIINEFLSADWLGIGSDIVNGLVSGINSVAKSAVGAFGSIIDSITVEAKRSPGTLNSIGAEAANGFAKGISGKKSETDGAAKKLVDSVSKSTSDLSTRLKKSGEQGASGLADGLSGKDVSVSTGKLVDSIVKSTASLKTSMKKSGEDGANGLIEGISGKKSETDEAAKKLVDSVLKSTSDLSTRLKKSGEQGASGLADGLSGKDVSASTRKLVDSIVKSTVSLKTSMKKSGEDGANGLIEGLESADTESAISQILESITSQTDSLPDVMRSAGEEGSGGIVEAILSNIEPARGAAQEITTAITSETENLSSDLLAAGTDGMSNLASGMSSGMASVKSSAESVYSSITGAFDGLPSVMTGIGYNVMMGLYNGIENGAGKVQEKVSSVVASIKSQITSAKGFDTHSPSKWSEQIGEYVDEGFANGVENGAGGMISAAQNAVDGVKNTVSEAANAAAEGAAKAFRAQKEILDHELAMGLIDQEAYYKRLEKLRDEFFLDEGNISEYLKITETLYSAEKDALKKAAENAQKEAEKAKNAQEQEIKDRLDAFKSGKEVLDHEYAMDLVDKETYYAKLKELRDKYLLDEGNISEYRKITETLYSAEKDALKKAAEDAQKEAEKAKNAQEQEIKDRLDAFKSGKEVLDHEYAMDLVDKETYYAKLKELRDKYLLDEENIGEYRRVSETLYSAEKEALKKTAEEEKKQAEEAQKAREQAVKDRLEAFKNGKAALDHEMAMDLIDKEAYYQRLGELSKTNLIDPENLSEALRVQEQIYSYQKSMYENTLKEQEAFDKERFELLKNQISDEKKYRNMSLQDQYKAWKEIQGKFLSDTEYYTKAEGEIYDLRIKIQDEYYQKVKEVAEKISSLENEYQSKLDSRTKEIVSSYGLFDRVNEREVVSGDYITRNLKGQIATMEEFYRNLDKLSKRGAPEELVEQIRDMGVDSVDELAALVRMSDSELEEYSELFRKKHKLAVEQATKELEPLRRETDEKIKEQLKSATDLYNENVDKVGEAFTGGLSESIRNGMDDVTSAAVDVVNTAISEALKAANSQSVGSAITSQLKSAAEESASRLSANLSSTVNNEATYRRQTQQAATAPIASSMTRLMQGTQNITLNLDGQKLGTATLPYIRNAASSNPVIKDDNKWGKIFL